MFKSSSMRMQRAWIVGLLIVSGCASLHHVQISDIDNTEKNQTRFDIKASETGLDVAQAASIAKAVSANRAVRQASNAASTIWALITYGPRVGNVTFSYNYADDLVTSLASVCPAGKITSLMSIRESNKYPVVSGEIVRLVGYCSHPKGKLNAKL
jgi:hypothetical protein